MCMYVFIVRITRTDRRSYTHTPMHTLKSSQYYFNNTKHKRMITKKQKLQRIKLITEKAAVYI